MLKSLFTKLKSQKSDSLSIKADKTQQIKSKQPINTQLHHSYQFRQLQQANYVSSEISSIRYSVQPQAPDIYNKVLGCPISNFNQLLFAKRKVKEIDLKLHPLPQYISFLDDILKKELPQYNHLLINVYPPGVGIMPHFDGPLYQSKVVVLSLGGPAIINFTENYGFTQYQGSSSKIGSLLLQDKSIHIFQKDAYEKFLHGISELKIDSIFFKLVKKEESEEYEIKSCSINNFMLTQLYKVFKQAVMDRIKSELQLQEIDLSEKCGYLCCFIPIKENGKFNGKIQIVRKQRISITIRQRYNNVETAIPNTQ